MKKSTYRRSLFLGAFLALSFLAAPSLALMPPHVTGTNIKDGVLQGDQLIIRGYTLGYSDLKKGLSITRIKDGQAVKYKHDLTCKMEGDCKSDRPGSCQERCELKITLSGLKNNASYKVTYLGLKQTFKVALTSAKPRKDGND